ncbi:phospholipid:diacylglycerol acyltransferase 1-like [Papaver somniferum]|uniref:phospholipid:diacylglycerol acyltransferase 1-like n=1 Tax=Papaver somniferum TaxID=3469 RepID=UPI000E6F9FFC|nr:phospholipid:diacylglycerol acyltransferase 1-like [Papaver somniferum]
MRDFLWDKSDTVKCYHPVKWKKFRTQLSKGGLGIKSLRSMNKALICKWWWRFNSEKQALWRRGMVSKYGSAGFDRETKAPKQAQGCGVWKNIYKHLQVFKSSSSIKVGEGTSVLFWEDRWVGDHPLATKFPHLYAIASTKNWTVNKCAATVNSGGSWNLGLDRRLSSIQIEEVCALISLLQNCYNGTGDDVLRCDIDKSGVGLLWVLPDCIDSIIKSWRYRIIHPIGKKLLPLLPAAICWTIWKSRNALVFENINFNVTEVIKQVKIQAYCWVRNDEVMKDNFLYKWAHEAVSVGEASSFDKFKVIVSSSSVVVSKEESSNSRSTHENESEDGAKYINQKKTSTKETTPKREGSRFSCIHNCFWFIGCVYSIWCLLFFLYNAKLTGPSPDLSPGVRLRKEGLVAKHPVVLVPGIITGGLELLEGHSCADGLFRERLWGGTFGEVYKRPLCWVQHMSLNNETGLDPDGIRVRPVPGLVAADYFAPGYFVWAVLIENLARIGYEDKNMYMASYDWRISFQNTEVRDQTLSRIKSNIELMVATNGGKKAVVIPHSMGALYFLHFMKWVEAPAPMGGDGGSDCCAKHIKAVMNIGGPFLGVPKEVSGLVSSEAKDVAVARAIAPGVLAKDLLRLPLQHLMRMTRTWDSTMSIIPKGGDTIWGGLDWSPDEGYDCNPKKTKRNNSGVVDQNGTVAEVCITKTAHYGRMVSFGKDVAEADPSEIERTDFRDALKGYNLANSTCDDLWKEYHDMQLWR